MASCSDGARVPVPGTVCAVCYCLLCFALGWGGVVPLTARPLPGRWVPYNATHWVWLKDAQVALPFHHSTVPTFPGLFLWCTAIPGFVSLGTALTGYGWQDWCCYWKGYGIAISTVVMWTNWGKNFVGRLRPCFYDRCDVEPFTTDLSSAPFCRASKSVTDAESKSFPSGHASYSMTVSVFCATYLFAKARRLFRARPDSAVLPGRLGCGSWGAVSLEPLWQWLAVVPLIGCAVFISASRVTDNRHFVSDVVAGDLLGAGAAVWAYRLYFPTPYGPGAIDHPAAEAAACPAESSRRTSRDLPLLACTGVSNTHGSQAA
eukprot:TRINITY_DN2594_c3_g1_i1.p2 TRINITY_DN2594_c3_g1~~TRINITY_DN2594_c3_g1_i1.p2  ORF type:complete len:350 (+),score=75.19 TRINITY_DN2594_c3_g1_i1:97-1050(+)